MAPYAIDIPEWIPRPNTSRQSRSYFRLRPPRLFDLKSSRTGTGHLFCRDTPRILARASRRDEERNESPRQSPRRSLSEGLTIHQKVSKWRSELRSVRFRLDAVPFHT